jgi:alkylation response protein AidB-like acyl-CoA dehydrogenase
MRFAFTAEQEALKQGARRFLAAHSSPAQVRRAMQSETGHDPEAWRRISSELGWPSLIIPEAYGGAGLGLVELIAILEETGRALLCAPLFSGVCLGTQALLAGGNEAQKRELLPGIAEGSTLAVLAFSDASGETIAEPADGGFLLRGFKHVLDGHLADWLIVSARAPDGLGLFLVPKEASGLERRRVGTLDQTRPQAEVRLDGVRVPAIARVGEPGNGERILDRTLDLAAIALAAEQVGGAERCLELSVEYAKVRTQFGRAIGSFQAVKHACADMLLAVESARSASYWAAFTAQSPGQRDASLRLAASLARATASDAYFHCASQAIQIHGGIGFTWEHDAHLYFKRARSSAALLGDAALHRERVAMEMGL